MTSIKSLNSPFKFIEARATFYVERVLYRLIHDRFLEATEKYVRLNKDIPSLSQSRYYYKQLQVTLYYCLLEMDLIQKESTGETLIEQMMILRRKVLSMRSLTAERLISLFLFTGIRTTLGTWSTQKHRHSNSFATLQRYSKSAILQTKMSEICEAFQWYDGVFFKRDRTYDITQLIYRVNVLSDANIRRILQLTQNKDDLKKTLESLPESVHQGFIDKLTPLISSEMEPVELICNLQNIESVPLWLY